MSENPTYPCDRCGIRYEPRAGTRLRLCRDCRAVRDPVWEVVARTGRAPAVLPAPPPEEEPGPPPPPPPPPMLEEGEPLAVCPDCGMTRHREAEEWSRCWACEALARVAIAGTSPVY